MDRKRRLAKPAAGKTFLTSVPPGAGQRKFQIKKKRPAPKPSKENEAPRDQFREKMLEQLETHLAKVFSDENERLRGENEGLVKEGLARSQALVEMEVRLAELQTLRESLENQAHRQTQLKEFFAEEVGRLRAELGEARQESQRLAEGKAELSAVVEALSEKFRQIERSASQTQESSGGLTRLPGRAAAPAGRAPRARPARAGRAEQARERAPRGRGARARGKPPPRGRGAPPGPFEEERPAERNKRGFGKGGGQNRGVG